MFADDYEGTHFIPTYDIQSNESIVPIAAFVAKRIATLKKSFATSTDADEKSEIVAMLLFHQSILLILCLSFLTESPELTDIAKEIFRQ
jgi:hypothetical protein